MSNTVDPKNPPEEYEDDWEFDDAFIPCNNCDGHDACMDFGCAFEYGWGHLVKKDLSSDDL